MRRTVGTGDVGRGLSVTPSYPCSLSLVLTSSDGTSLTTSYTYKAPPALFSSLGFCLLLYKALITICKLGLS